MIDKILKKLSNLEWLFADYYPDETAIHRVTKKSVAYDEVVAIVQEVAKEYGNEYEKGKSDLSAEIMKYINSSNRNNADYFIVDQIEELCSKYIEQKGE